MPGWIERGITPRVAPAAAAPPRRKPVRVEPATSLEEALRKLNIRHFDRDILEQMTLPELREHFGYKQNVPRIASVRRRRKKKKRRKRSEFRMEILLRNVIWQLHEQIRAGTILEFVRKRGMIRGMWYHIKTRLHQHKPLRGDYYSTMIKMLADMVEAGVVSYQDFWFRDRDQTLWHLGSDNPYVFVVCEKDGFISYTEEYVMTYGCSAMTMGGSPSMMSVDYFVQRMVKAGMDLSRKFAVFSIVDFDPKGEDAARDFISHLELFGVRNFHRFRLYGVDDEKRMDLIQPKYLAANESGTGGLAYTLPTSEWDSALGRSWFERTGGVNGDRKLGLESDECTGERIHELLLEHMVPLLPTGVQVVQKRIQTRRLRKALANLLVFKQTGMLPEEEVIRPRDPTRS
jgi:hypothetical protein